jgi:DNA-binding GntR family transcriptional regulator
MIEARDVDRAASEMNAHVLRARNQLLGYLRRNELDQGVSVDEDV